MQGDSPEIKVVKALRDCARSIRSMTQDAGVAQVALEQEIKFSQQVETLEAQQEQPQLALNGSDAAA